MRQAHFAMTCARHRHLFVVWANYDAGGPMSETITGASATHARRLQRVSRAGTATLLIAAAGLAAGVAKAHAQGWIEPRPGIVPAEWSIEKLRTNVTVRVNGRVAQVEVEEWFRNNGSRMGEGDYVYPLAGEAVFTGYSLYQGDQELRGEMMDAAHAREIYERIVRAQRDPALIELIGKGMMRARVFPIEAGQTRRIRLRYTQVLERAGDAMQFRYAAGVQNGGARTMVGPFARSRNGSPRNDDAREHPSIEFSIIVDDEARYRDAFSPTHTVHVQRDGGRMTVRPRDALSGGFSVFLPFAERTVGVSMATHRPVGEAGYFMLTLSPRDAAVEARVPRDITVVVDVSGSMSGEKMEQARRALTQLIGTLGRDDRLRLIAFSSTVRHWREGWSAATPSDLRAARTWIADLRAEGGTNIHDALSAAFAAETAASRLPIVIFMTDGLPTNGERRPDHIVAMAETARGRARVFAFGVGFDVNTYLLDRLSEAARGTTQYVRPDEDVEQAVSALAAKVRHPVLTDLALVHGGIDITDVYPRELPDLFAGEDLVLFGRYSGTGNARVGVAGRRNGAAERYTTEVRLTGTQAANDFIPRLWAARRLGDLDRRIRSAQADGASPDQIRDMVEELRATALRHGLLSEYTAYLVLEPGAIAGTGRDAILQMPPPPVSGEMAVARAEEARRAREVSSVAQMDEAQKLASARAAMSAHIVSPSTAMDTDARQSVAGRTFRLKDGIWSDIAIDPAIRTIDIAAFSDAYFALLRALPELERVLAELDSVHVAGRRVNVRVRATGGTTKLDVRALRTLQADFR
jgi:Ca-activated chloride channel homolog